MIVSVQGINAFKDNYIWLLLDKNQAQAMVVDPGDAKPVIETLLKHNIKLCAVLITHHHWDHSNGLMELKQRFNVPVFGPAYESIEGIDHALHENDNIEDYGLPFSLRVLHIPGHTLGHIAYYGSNKLFCGDTLFSVGCGKLFEGTPQQMVQSLQKLCALPDETEIYCGHEYTKANIEFALKVDPDNRQLQQHEQKVNALLQSQQPSLPSNLLLEKAINPFLRCEEPAIIKAVQHQANSDTRDPVTVFHLLREWKNQFKSHGNKETSDRLA